MLSHRARPRGAGSTRWCRRSTLRARAAARAARASAAAARPRRRCWRSPASSAAAALRRQLDGDRGHARMIDDVAARRRRSLARRRSVVARARYGVLRSQRCIDPGCDRAAMSRAVCPASWRSGWRCRGGCRRGLISSDVTKVTFDLPTQTYRFDTRESMLEGAAAQRFRASAVRRRVRLSPTAVTRRRRRPARLHAPRRWSCEAAVCALEFPVDVEPEDRPQETGAVARRA